MQAVSAKLAGVVEVGDGVVSRACRELQREYFEPDTAIGHAGRSLLSGSLRAILQDRLAA